MKTSTREAIERELLAVREVSAVAEKENRDLTGEERKSITDALNRATAAKKAGEDADAIARQVDELTGGIGDPLPGNDAKTHVGRPAHPATGVGQSFIDSPEFKTMVAAAPNGRFGEKSRVQSQPFAVKALITGADDTGSAGTLVNPDQRGLLAPYYARPLTLRNLVAGGTTGSDTVEYVRVLTTTNNAAPVPEATTAAAIGGSVTTVLGGVKPESAITLERASTTVKTIATWIPATKRALSDAPQVRTLIDTFLMTGLEEETEDQIMGGDGAGENFLGLMHISDVQTEAGGTGDVFDASRRARRKVRIGGRAIPTAFAFNPLDWENVELMRDSENRFFGAGPWQMGPGTLWGLPVVESEAVPAGTAWCAAWRMAILYDREQASIQVTDTHADFFIRNLVAILAELRAAFAVLRPQAFVKITL